MNLNEEINTILKNAGVQLLEANNSAKIDKLMADYERAKSDYHAADFYDDNYSWRSGRNSASSRMDEIEKELKSLTGKGYDELLDTLGSKKVHKDKGPKLKVGDIYNKNGRLYKVVKVVKNVFKSRALEDTYYRYELKGVDSCYVDFISDMDVQLKNKVRKKVK